MFARAGEATTESTTCHNPGWISRASLNLDDLKQGEIQKIQSRHEVKYPEPYKDEKLESNLQSCTMSSFGQDLEQGCKLEAPSREQVCRSKREFSVPPKEKFRYRYSSES